MRNKRYNVALKDGTTLELMYDSHFWKEDTLLDDIVKNGIKREMPSGNMEWYPPHMIEMIYFKRDKDV